MTGKDHLLLACEQLGIACVPDFAFRTPDEDVIKCDVLISQFSDFAGMMVFDTTSYDTGFISNKALLDNGYSVTSWDLNTPSRSAFDLDRFIEMFSEWGWSGPEAERPAWVRLFVPDQD